MFDHLDWKIEDFKQISPHIQYLVAQKEKAPSTNNPHWQGHIEMQRPITTSAARGLANWHIERARNITASIAYAQKEDTRLEPPISFGLPSTQGERHDLLQFRDAIKQGQGMIQIMADDNLAKSMIKYHRFFESYRNELQREQLRALQIVPTVTWIWGEPGVGKTRHVHQHAVGHIYTADMLPWFDGYRNQPNILLDDFRSDSYPFEKLLRLLDRYPLLLPVKGSSIMRNSTHIWITTTNPPENTYTWSSENMQQLTRRITNIINLT